MSKSPSKEDPPNQFPAGSLSPPPTPILGQTIGRCIYLAVSLTKRRLRGVKWEGPFRREEGSARVLAISARPLMSISPTPLKSSFGQEKHASCSTINKGLLTGKQMMRCCLLCIFFCLCDWVFFVLFCSLGKKQAIQASSKGAKKTKNKSQLHELVTDLILFSITALMLCTNKISPKNEINLYTPICQ